MSLGRVLAEYASRNGLGGIDPRPDGSYLLIFDDRYKVRFAAEGAGAAVIRGRIGGLPSEDRERREAVERLLDVATARMRGAAEIVTVTEDEREAILFRRFATDLAPSAFEAILTAFINGLAFWQHAYAAGTPRPAMASPMMMHGRAF